MFLRSSSVIGEDPWLLQGKDIALQSSFNIHFLTAVCLLTEQFCKWGWMSWSHRNGVGYNGEGFHEDVPLFSILSLILSLTPSQSTSLCEFASQLSCSILLSYSLCHLPLDSRQTYFILPRDFISDHVSYHHSPAFPFIQPVQKWTKAKG